MNKTKNILLTSALFLIGMQADALTGNNACFEGENVSICDSLNLSSAEDWGMPLDLKLKEFIKPEGVEVHRNIEANSSVIAVRGEPLVSYQRGFDRIVSILKQQGYVEEDSIDDHIRVLMSENENTMYVLSFHEGLVNQVSVAYWQAQSLTLLESAGL